MALSYQAKHRAKKWLKIAAACLGVVLLFCIGRFVYLQRFLVYDENGVHLDYGGQPAYGKLPTDAVHEEDYILKQSGTVGSLDGSRGNYKTFAGYSVSAKQLLDTDALPDILTAVNGVNAVMLDMKTATGKYLYNTAISGTETAKTDLAAIEAFVADLANRHGVTLIARIPAFCDSAKALSLRNQALPIAGGALWIDENGSYWLDPKGADVADHLIATARELEKMGFDEILFTDFRFPGSQYIRYESTDAGRAAVRDAAQTVKTRLDVYDIPVSFLSDDETVTSLSARFYTEAENGNQVKPLAKQYAELTKGEDGRLVFLTDSRDTRFNAYSKLQPLDME